MVRKIGILFGMEDTFPWALIDVINARSSEGVAADPVAVSFLKDHASFEYDLILDRISHVVPFYRTFLKAAIYQGIQVINNPFWSSSDDKYFGTMVAASLGVAVPRTVLLPHKQHPPNTGAKSFRNLQFVDWDEVFRYLGFPIFLKPAYGSGWKDIYRCETRESFFSAYDRTRDLCMMAQETIQSTEYHRCYVLGRTRVHVMRYDPSQPHHLRYVPDPPPMETNLRSRVERDAVALCIGLGYDMNTAEFAVRDGIPYAIDFMNCAPDTDLHSVGKVNFDWVVSNTADLLIERVLHPRPFVATGTWPEFRRHRQG